MGLCPLLGRYVPPWDGGGGPRGKRARLGAGGGSCVPAFAQASEWGLSAPARI
jgi:hypothetical protein